MQNMLQYILSFKLKTFCRCLITNNCEAGTERETNLLWNHEATQRSRWQRMSTSKMIIFNTECVGVRLLWETDAADPPSWYHGLLGEAAGLLKGAAWIIPVWCRAALWSLQTAERSKGASGVDQPWSGTSTHFHRCGPPWSGELGTLRVAWLCDSAVAVVTNLEKAGNICGEANALGPRRGEPGGKQVRLFHLATGQVSRKQVTVWLHSRQKRQSRAVCTGALPKWAWEEKERKKEGTPPTSTFPTLV